MENQRPNLDSFEPNSAETLSFYRHVVGKEVTIQEIDENNFRFNVEDLDAAVQRAMAYDGNCRVFEMPDPVLGVKVAIITRHIRGLGNTDLQLLILHEDVLYKL